MVKRAYTRRKHKETVGSDGAPKESEGRPVSGGRDAGPGILLKGSEGSPHGSGPLDGTFAALVEEAVRSESGRGHSPQREGIEGPLSGSEVRRGEDVPQRNGSGSDQEIHVSRPEGEKMSEPVKKGRPSWKPAHRMEILKKSPGFRYRYCLDDPDNLDKKQLEGWRFVNKTTGHVAEHVEEHAPTTGTLKRRELVVMALPEELAKERDEFYAKRTRNQTASIKKRLQAQMDEAAGQGPKAQAEGKITIIE